MMFGFEHVTMQLRELCGSPTFNLKKCFATIKEHPRHLFNCKNDAKNAHSTTHTLIVAQAAHSIAQSSSQSTAPSGMASNDNPLHFALLRISAAQILRSAGLTGSKPSVLDAVTGMTLPSIHFCATVDQTLNRHTRTLPRPPRLNHCDLCCKQQPRYCGALRPSRSI